MNAPAEVHIARIGKPHGLRGEVTVQVFTDQPAVRFVSGAKFTTRNAPPGVNTLTLRSARMHGRIQLLAFAGYFDRTAAEQLRGTQIYAERTTNEEGWYADELRGYVAYSREEKIGIVRELLVRPAQDLLVLDTPGGEALVPFVKDLVVEINSSNHEVHLDLPAGLLDINQEDS